MFSSPTRSSASADRNLTASPSSALQRHNSSGLYTGPNSSGSTTFFPSGGEPYTSSGQSFQGPPGRRRGDGLKTFNNKAKKRRAPITEINNLSILYSPPVEGCELKPYVLLRDEEEMTCAPDVDDEMQYRWYRGQKRICSAPSCQKAATMQCITCLKFRLPAHMSYFCNAECFQETWPMLRQMFQQHAARFAAEREKGSLWHDDDIDANSEKFVDCDGPIPRMFNERNDNLDEQGPAARGQIGSPRKLDTDSPASVSCKFPPTLSNIWAEVSREKLYTPQPEDIGRMLMLECAPVLKNKDGEERLGPWFRKVSPPVLPKPKPPPPRNMVHTQHHNPSISKTNGFKVLCYNTLADIYATSQVYPYCPLWALSWSYRRNNLLREILSYQADVVCLQEVQGDHFEDFFQPQMSLNGYDGIFKHKTRESFGANPKAIDGCAVFYKKDRFALMEQYGIEFNEAASRSINRQSEKYREKMRRLMKGNIGLVLVLEEITSADGRTARSQGRRKRRICVANTHMYWDPEFAEVKLWQTWVLCQELQKLVLPRDLPLILCGDFNSEPDSSVYELLSTERLRADHPVFRKDPKKILPPPENIIHQLPLESAYNVIGEPKWTNYTGHFVGILDYIWFSKNHLRCTAVLDVDEEERLKKHTALPSETYSSDHISLFAEFTWMS